MNSNSTNLNYKFAPIKMTEKIIFSIKKNYASRKGGARSPIMLLWREI